jgi:hypothetical protein
VVGLEVLLDFYKEKSDYLAMMFPIFSSLLFRALIRKSSKCVERLLKELESLGDGVILGEEVLEAAS